MRTKSVVCFACCWLLLAPSAAGQDESVRTIVAVEFKGLVRTSEALARDVAGVNIGDPFEVKAANEAVNRLLGTGRFVAAPYDVTEVSGGVRLTFKLHELQTITSVGFEGNQKFNDAQLKKQVDVNVGDGVDRFAISDGRDAIIAMYRDAGFDRVVVQYDLERIERAGDLVYRIEEGKQVRISKIVFEGNTSIPAEQLERHVDTKPAFWVFRTGAFDEDRVNSDVAHVQAYYRDRGFLDAKVSYRREFSDDGRKIVLVFVVVEGTRYSVESIEFRGNAVLTREELLDLMETEVGAVMFRRQLDADVRSIQVRYGELGHIYMTARAVRVFSDTPGLVRVTVEINEGESYRVGRVLVQGNARTQDKVVRRELNLYPPDDLFDMTEALEAERRLSALRIFSAARVYPVGNDPGVRDVVIDVKETEKAGDFLFGLGVTSNSGLAGNVVLDLQNFDINDWPRNWSELRKFRAFFGGGQRFRLELQPGTQVSRFRIDFSEPYLFDKPVRFDTSLYLFGRGRDGYREKRSGGNISFGKRFERGAWQGWSGELAFRVENVTIDDLDIFASRVIREDKGSNLMTSLKTTLVRDWTDSRYIPSSGDRLRIGYEQFGVLGGTHTFGKVSASYARYETIHKDMLDRKSVLQIRAEGGAIIGRAPIFERYYAGGTGSIRGFEFRGVGPRDGIDKNNVGGGFLVLLGAEYSFPLYGQNVRGLLFVDSGAVGSSTWRASIGGGIRFTINLFGPVPLELDLAIPVLSDPDDEEQVFSFLVGGLF